MEKVYFGLLMVIFMSACKKDKPAVQEPSTPHPVMQYLDLHDESMFFGGSRIIDVNSDGTQDFLFSTLLVGDPVLQRDRRQFYISSSTTSHLLMDVNDQSPVFSSNAEIKLQHNGYQWFEVVSLLLAEKIIPLTGSNFWQGAWRDLNHKFIGIQVKKNGNIHNGWIEISFSTAAEKIIFHRAAISTEPGKAVRAGL